MRFCTSFGTDRTAVRESGERGHANYGAATPQLEAFVQALEDCFVER